MLATLSDYPASLHAEVRKTTGFRSAWIQLLLGVAVLSGTTAFTMGKGAVTMLERGDSTGVTVFSAPDVISMGWTKAGIVALMIWAGMLVTTELRTTLPLTWLAVPSRTLVLGAKASLAAAGAFLWTLLVMPALVAIARSAGAQTPVTLATALMIAKVALGAGVLAALSVGLAAGTRSLSAVLIVWGLTLISDESLAMVSPLRPLGWFMPMSNLWHFSGVSVYETVTPPWPPTLSLVYLLALAALLLGVGGWRLRQH